MFYSTKAGEDETKIPRQLLHATVDQWDAVPKGMTDQGSSRDWVV